MLEEGTSKLKRPSKSVLVPEEVPLTITLTPGNGIPDISVTVPVTRTSVPVWLKSPEVSNPNKIKDNIDFIKYILEIKSRIKET